MNSNISRRRVLQYMGVCAGAALVPALRAQEVWPTRPVHFIVPFNPGGATDLVARSISEALSPRIGQSVIVENKGGAAGMLGTNTVVRARPDGYTLALSLSTSLLINQFLYKDMAYSPQRDLIMLSQIASAPVTLVVHPSLPANNMQELLAYVKANKSKLSYGSWGVGSYSHLGGAAMSKSMDADMTHVAFKGESPMIQELIGGRLHLCFSSALNTKPFIEAGRLKVIGVTGKQRMDILPDVPTIYEQGIHDEAYSIAGWVALAAPAGTPDEIVNQIYDHLQAIAKDPKVQERIRSAGFISMMNSPKEFQENYKRDLPVWQKLIEEAGARAD